MNITLMFAELDKRMEFELVGTKIMLDHIIKKHYRRKRLHSTQYPSLTSNEAVTSVFVPPTKFSCNES